MNGSADSYLVTAAVVALIIVRQLKVRPLREDTPVVLLGILTVLGVAGLVFGVTSVTKLHPVAGGAVALLLLSLLVAVGFGVVRAMTVRVWREPDGTALRQGTPLTTALWVAAIVVHFALDAWIDHVDRGGALGPATVYLYIALTLGAQGVVLRRRLPGTAPALARWRRTL
ncbi:hypothetical protein ACIGXM_27050 [Kitasatospora sp. NPDC052896]|uniref:hypothetical protein n=1 Tax=Kitasatospora sp. NPDC052896 TaxID=3364061 RepID=UPI0037C63246